MHHIMSEPTNTTRLNDTLSQAKALRLTAKLGGITYEEGKAKAEELLKIVNRAGKEIAKKYGRKYKKIRFSDL